MIVGVLPTKFGQFVTPQEVTGTSRWLIFVLKFIISPFGYHSVGHLSVAFYKSV